MTRRYTLHFSDGKRCTVIVMDSKLSEDEVRDGLQKQFQPGYLEEVVRK